jgi:hypothetical protein
MKFNYFFNLKSFNLIILTLIFGQFCFSQIVSSNAFLKGNFVEVGVGPCGAFASTVAAPAGYHPRGAGNSSVASQLGFVADPAQDGWGVGTPNYAGDYFLPGNPEEGWGVSINGTSYNNNLICGLTQIPGSVISYNSSSSEVSATWQGSVGGLSITARTYIPVNSVYFVTEVTVLNTSTATLNNVYYMRNVDPDQAQNTPGLGGYSTTNTIVYQNPDICNRALVSAVSAGSLYLGLGTIDSRARVTRGGFGNRNAVDVWNGTGGLSNSGSLLADQAISISFNLGTLAPNQSTSFAYAYILNQS